MEGNHGFFYEFITHMTGTKWIIIGIVLLMFELLTGTMYILWPAIAALIVGVIVYILPLGWQMQFLLFFLISTALLVYGQLYVRPRVNKVGSDDLNDRAQTMIGQTVRAVGVFKSGRGRVKVGDTQWRAQLVEGSANAGDELIIQSVKGTTLMVTVKA